MERLIHSNEPHVVVVGGGIAGLLAARVLWDFYPHITLIERDHYPNDPVFRPGVPQGRHLHLLLTKGQTLLEELFPGFLTRFVEQGAVPTDILLDLAMRYPTGWLQRTASPLTLYGCTRPLLEGLVRQEVLRSTTVKILEGYEVTSLHFDAQKEAITGVHARRRGHDNSTDESHEMELDANLVIDASGRDSHILRWLEAGGFPLPKETILDPALGYASCFYQPAPETQHTWRGMFMAADPPRMLRGGWIMPVEGQRWHVVLAGVSHDYPPTDPDEFMNFACGMLDPAFAEALQQAERITPIYSYRHTANRWRHFEQLKRFPEGLLVLGDAVCALDPTNGQGMTTAAMGAFALKMCLEKQTPGRLFGLSRRFQRSLAQVNKTPWDLSVSAGYRALPPEKQTHGWIARLVSRYVDRITALLPTSASLCIALGKVTHLLEPPYSLFRPAIVWTVFTHPRALPDQRESAQQSHDERRS